jgi:hypothetical protein
MKTQTVCIEERKLIIRIISNSPEIRTEYRHTSWLLESDAARDEQHQIGCVGRSEQTFQTAPRWEVSLWCVKFMLDTLPKASRHCIKIFQGTGCAIIISCGPEVGHPLGDLSSNSSERKAVCFWSVPLTNELHGTKSFLRSWEGLRWSRNSCFYETLRFIIVLTRISMWSLFWARWIQFRHSLAYLLKIHLYFIIEYSYA